MLAGRALAGPTVDVVASNWKFTPNTIVMHVGETTALHMTSSGGVHGIASDELGIPQTTIMPGKFVDVSVTPKKAGTYKVHCAIQCGAGHGDMLMTVEVMAPFPIVDIVASNWKFTPNKIAMHVGETTLLHLTSSGGVHGIASDELGIPQTTIMPGKFVDVSVTPKKAGTYKVRCAIQCGAGHGNMLLTVEVTAPVHPVVDIVASNWKFTPNKIALHVGETTTLHLTSSGGVHGVGSDELGIQQTTIMPNKFVDVSVTPKKAGTFQIRCSIMCGSGHGDMVLTVDVQP